jgi:NAD(P)-dependent dehydrogenase (short-subunit alcohol dehydrogenase family)
MMETIVITGANRGIGLEFAKRYLDEGKQVVASCRQPAHADELQRLAAADSRLQILQLDVTSDDSIAAFAQQIAHDRVDILINNAGVLGGDRQSIDDMDFDEWMRTLRVNSVAPLQVSLALRTRLQRSDRPLLPMGWDGASLVATNCLMGGG